MLILVLILMLVPVLMLTPDNHLHVHLYLELNLGQSIPYTTTTGGTRKGIGDDACESFKRYNMAHSIDAVQLRKRCHLFGRGVVQEFGCDIVRAVTPRYSGNT